MKNCLATIAALSLLLVPSVPAAEEQVDEKAYALLAARVVATADACTALGIIEPGLGFLDEIEVAMLGFGAVPEEVEEWISNVVSRNSSAIQAILKAEPDDAAWLECTKGLDDKRVKLAAILNGDSAEEVPADDEAPAEEE
jgi:hypothetical protein